MSIVMECCEAYKSKQMISKIQSICELMLQILEMALYLELCVLNICGIRPVLGRVEDFSKQLRLFLAGRSLVICLNRDFFICGFLFGVCKINLPCRCK